MPVRTRRTWVVVANGTTAKALENDGVGKGLNPTPSFEMHVDTSPTRDLGSDRPGRVHDRFGPGRHSMEPKADWHRQEKTAFAKAIAERLASAARDGTVDRLILVAPPAMMGDLRSALDDHAQSLISGELTKDLTQRPNAEIADHIGEFLAV